MLELGAFGVGGKNQNFQGTTSSAAAPFLETVAFLNSNVCSAQLLKICRWYIDFVEQHFRPEILSLFSKHSRSNGHTVWSLTER